MREKKYRVWDSKEKRMLYFSMEDLLCGDVELSTNCTEPMEYINYCDKNNKEIYEEDIINDEGNISIVKYDNYENEGNFGDGEGYVGYNVCTWTGYPPHKPEIEIIGNIHENPELLEEPK